MGVLYDSTDTLPCPARHCHAARDSPGNCPQVCYWGKGVVEPGEVAPSRTTPTDVASIQGEEEKTKQKKGNKRTAEKQTDHKSRRRSYGRGATAGRASGDRRGARKGCARRQGDKPGCAGRVSRPARVESTWEFAVCVCRPRRLKFSCIQFSIPSDAPCAPAPRSPLRHIASWTRRPVGSARERQVRP